jgi:glycerol kinase
LLDAYFSATKLHWILENVPGARERAEKGDLLFGTIETWLIWKMTGGQSTRDRLFQRFQDHDVQYPYHWNGIRTFWTSSTYLRTMLPEPVPSSQIYGESAELVFGGPVKIAGAAGDQQAALFGQTCFEPGEAKSTYGTGNFLLMNTGEKPVVSGNGLLTTIAWGLDGRVNYALEGSVFVCGAAIQWLRDELNILSNAAESEAMALSVEDSAGVFMVPAFVGLGAPYWDPYARGAIFGLTRGANKKHLVRATLESMAYQCSDLLGAMSQDMGSRLPLLKVDGGACANNFLMQFQADILGCPVERPACIETTSLGAAYLAGLATGYWKDKQDVKENCLIEQVFTPAMDEKTRGELLAGWSRAVSRTRDWDKSER